MSSYIKQPAALHEAGSRDLNQDYVYPPEGQANESSRLFIVCDGVGGPNKGNVAAELVAEHFAKHIVEFPPDGELYKGYLEQTLISTEEALSTYVKTYPDATGMGTTLALVYLSGTQAVFAWVGNSQIFHYQAKTGKLVATEKTTIEPSQDSLMWEPIHQKIHGTETPTQLQVKNVELGHGDYIFLCSDGVLEQLAESTLRTLFETGEAPEVLVREIQALAEKGSTQDNYSCYMIQMDLEDEPVAAPVPPAKTDATKKRKRSAPAPESELGYVTIADKIAQQKRQEAYRKQQAGSTAPPPPPAPDPDPATASGESAPHEEKRSLDFGFVGVIAIGALIIAAIGWFIWGNVGPAEEVIAQGKAYEAQQNYARAIELYDSAHDATMDAEARKRLRAAADEARETMMSLQPSARELLTSGQAAFENGNYQKAVQDLQAARDQFQKEGRMPTNFPHAALAESYIRLGDELFARSELSLEQQEQVLAWYDQAADIYENPDLALENSDLMDRAYKRSEELSKRSSEDLIASRGVAARSESEPDQKAASPRSVDARPNVSPEDASNTAASKRSVPPATARPASNESTARTSSFESLRTQASDRARSNAASSSSGRAPSSEEQYLADGKAWYEKAKKEEEGDQEYAYRMAVEYLTRAGDALDADGAYWLSYMYHMGYGVEADPDQALKYAQISANKGHAGGHYLYANCLLDRGGRIDRANALKSLRIAADKKYPPAVKMLARLTN